MLPSALRIGSVLNRSQWARSGRLVQSFNLWRPARETTSSQKLSIKFEAAVGRAAHAALNQGGSEHDLVVRCIVLPSTSKQKAHGDRLKPNIA